MSRYILRRLWTSIPVLFIITAITFLMINLAPGDPVDFLLDEGASVETVGQRLGWEGWKSQASPG